MATLGARGFVGLAVGLVALGSLLSTAVHANTTATSLVTPAQQQEADTSNDYYNCLDAQGHHLIRPHDVAWVAQDNLASWVEVTKAIGGWAHLTERRLHATVAVLLVNEPAGSPSTCQGQVLVTIRQTRTGRVLMSRAAPGQP